MTVPSRDSYHTITQGKRQLAQTVRQHLVQETQGHRGHKYIKNEKENASPDIMKYKQSGSVSTKLKPTKRQRVPSKNRNYSGQKATILTKEKKHKVIPDKYEHDARLLYNFK